MHACKRVRTRDPPFAQGPPRRSFYVARVVLIASRRIPGERKEPMNEHAPSIETALCDATTRLALFSILAALATLCGCGPTTATPPTCDRTVSPGPGDDTAAAQTMFVEARDGETLCFAPGTYEITETLEIRDRTGVTIRGAGATRADVVLDFFGQAAGAKGISATGMTDVVIENLTALDSPGDDIYVTGSTGVTIRNVRAGWVRRVGMMPGSYALYPVNSTGVLVEDTETFGGADSGIYVGQTENCIVRGNDVHDNVGGIEIENSTNCEVHDNDVVDNTVGVLVFEVPGLPLRGSTTSVHDNHICSNNTPNFGYPGTPVAGLPPGIGIMLLAANRVDVHHNEICDNDSTGILVLGYATSGLPDPMDATYDGFAEDICLHDNTFPEAMPNGLMPESPVSIIQDLAMPRPDPMEDILVDGVFASAEELSVDMTGRFRDANAPSMFTAQSTDRTPYLRACPTPVPPVTL